MAWMVRKLYHLIADVWIWDWPPTSWLVAVVLVLMQTMIIGLVIRYLLLPGLSWLGSWEQRTSTDQPEQDSGSDGNEHML